MNKRGLTVVELLVTVFVFALLTLTVVPGMRAFFARLEINSSLRTLTAALGTARYQAIQENRPVRAEVVPGWLRLSVDNGRGWQVTRSFVLSEKLSIRANSRPVFSPLGNVSPLCTITVEQQKKVYRVVLSMYGRIRVYDNNG
jgi:Tfp pilus assembly protein FimT